MTLVAVVGLVAGEFYFISGELVSKTLEAQIAMLETKGVAIEERTTSGKTEHFVISLADTRKFAKLIPEYEKFLLAEDKSALKEFRLGVDLTASTMGAGVSAESTL